MSALAFLDLPGELRNQIYNVFLTDLVEQSQQSPCQSRQSNTSASDYLSLLLTCKQVSRELLARFQREYASRLTISYDDTTKLSALVQALHKNPRSPVSQARFSLRSWARMTGPKLDLSVPSNTECEKMSLLLQIQPGFRSAWLEQPGLYETESDGWNETDQATMRRLGIPDYDFEPWNAADEGFVASTGNHSKCCTSGSCLDYSQLSWPVLDNKCQLTTYSWVTPTHRDTCMMLEGRLSDLYCPEAACCV